MNLPDPLHKLMRPRRDLEYPVNQFKEAPPIDRMKGNEGFCLFVLIDDLIGPVPLRPVHLLKNAFHFVLEKLGLTKQSHLFG